VGLVSCNLSRILKRPNLRVRSLGVNIEHMRRGQFWVPLRRGPKADKEE
jgi:hypothetical protein